MSSYRENAIKRRDFRSVKAAPEAPGALRSKKTKRPIIVLSRYKPDFFEKNKDCYWGISTEAKKCNNQWRKYSTYITVTAAEQAIAHWEKDTYWGSHYEFKIIDTRVK